jgi:hypothetical protein
METMTVESKAKHTPGPWELGHELGEGFSIVREIAPHSGQLLVVATSGTQKKFMGHQIDRETAQANARLIAAAPELLEACKRLLIAHTANIQAQGYEFDAWSRLAEAAIAKAEGQ